MSDLSVGNHADVVLNAGDVLRVSTGGVATVVVAYGAPAGATTITANTQDFGPYSVPAKLAVNAVTGTASYSNVAAYPVVKMPDGTLQAGGSPVSGDGNSVSVLTYKGVSTDGSDITAALSNADLDAATKGLILFFPPGNYLISTITAAANWNMHPDAWITTNSTTHIVTVASDVAKITRINVDANLGYFQSGVRFAGNSTQAETISVKRLRSPLGSGVNAAVVFTGNNNNVKYIDVSDAANTGNTNGSMPQSLAFQGSADGNRVTRLTVRNVHCVLVTASTGSNFFNTISAINAADNGCYNTTGTVTIDILDYQGSEEALVCQSTANIGTMIVANAQNSAISIQNAISLDVGTLIVRGGVGCILKTRVGNVAAGDIRIGAVQGYMTGASLFDCQTGTIKHLSVSNVKLKYIYDAAKTGTLSRWGDLSGCFGYSLNNWDVRITDPSNSLTGSDVFYIKGSTQLNKKSTVKFIDVAIFTADEITLSAATYRGQSLSTALCETVGLRWQVNIGPYAREVSFGFPDEVAATPATGTWSRGQRFNRQNPAVGAPAGYVCTASGSPGTWTLLPNL